METIRPSSDEQLREIIFYIADDSGSVDIALNYFFIVLKEASKYADLKAFRI